MDAVRKAVTAPPMSPVELIVLGAMVLVIIGWVVFMVFTGRDDEEEGEE